MEAVAIPVFQFGMFSDVDLSFFAGPNFDFGGRVHTNGNLFLSQGDGATLTLSDKVTAVKEIIRQRLQNGVSIDTPSTHDGTVSAKASPTTFRSLAANRRQPGGRPRQRAERADLAHDFAEHLQQLDSQRPDRRQGAEPAADHRRRQPTRT